MIFRRAEASITALSAGEYPLDFLGGPNDAALIDGFPAALHGWPQPAETRS
jgi:hypothetical protein